MPTYLDRDIIYVRYPSIRTPGRRHFDIVIGKARVYRAPSLCPPIVRYLFLTGPVFCDLFPISIMDRK